MKDVAEFICHPGTPKELREAALDIPKMQKWVKLPRTDFELKAALDFIYAHCANQRKIIEDEIVDRRHNELVAVAKSEAKRGEVHTLAAWWRLATRDEKIGMLGVFATIFLVGYLSAKMNFLSRAIDLIRDILP